MRRLLLLAALLLAGCRGPGVYLAPGVPFRVRAPEEGPAFFANQEVVFELPDGRRETALATVENRGGHLTVVAATPMGQTLLVLTLKGPAVFTDARIPIPADLDPRALAGLVQFCLWPAESVREGLAGSGATLEEEGPVRRLVRKGRPVWVATREGDAPPYRRILLENPSLRLRVQVRTLVE